MARKLLIAPLTMIATLIPGVANCQSAKPIPLIAPREALKISNILLVEKNDTPTFTRELIRLSYRSGDPVLIYLCIPKNVKKPPVALVTYTFPQLATSRFLKDDYCKWITDKGIAFAGFEPSYTGERYKSGPMKEWFISELPVSMSRTVHDVQIIIDYLGSRGELDKTRVGMFGQGSGGTAGILASSVDPRIKVLDALSPWGDWKNWTKSASEIRTPEDRKRFSSNPFLKTIEPYDPFVHLPKVKAQHLRMQFIRKTANVVDAAVDRMVKAAPARTVKKVYSDPSSSVKEMTDGKVFNWIAAKLKSL
jgi:hypothetical protein